MTRAAYPAYRDSGVEWLGRVPAHWQVCQTRFCAEVNPSAADTRKLSPTTEVSFVPMEAVGEYGGLELSEVHPLEDVGSGYTGFTDGDVIVAKITPCFENGKGALARGLRNSVAFGTTELHVLRPGPTLHGPFLFYLTISSPYRVAGEAEMTGAAGQKRVPTEFMKEFPLPLPPLEEQRVIAAFLDRETARVDALIEKKRLFIERLEEQRTALISRAVTRGLPPDAARAAGLDPSPRLKPSGVEWLGEVPEHWEVTRLKRAVPAVTVGIVVTPAKYYEEEGVPCLRSLNVLPGRLVDQDLVFISDESNELHRKSMIFEGDVVVVRTGRPGTAAAVDSRFDGANAIDLIIVRRSKAIQPAWLVYAFAAQAIREQVMAGSGGAIQQHFNIEDVRGLVVAVPPVAEQQKVVEYLDSQTGKIDRVASTTRRAIERLEERRTALITATVTGKIDVRESAGVAAAG